ncbi:hemin uptake protein HemP [Methylocystis parvus]|uniref:Hemin uptake protein HemP n=1 Tax=Methylocystis parvus TaxID=134 RepID=A0A6B8M4R7_9HYPH|nr:hemin uptake protein HemP [Methylocystis parvus]QGM97325.1 hemin uptake protein HemP [Methylocystis parvus]WBJ98764.1 hemin uptake protein HemP [Methylocystis parvus OBBP]
MTKQIDRTGEAKPSPDSKTGSASPRSEFDARELLGPRQEAIILHAGERYRLRITANNKLILTK